MARDTMTWLIALLRTKVNDADESIWTNGQLQDYLDMHRVHVRREFLTKNADAQVYYSKFGMFEDDLTVWDGDSAGAKEVPSGDYTVNLGDGTFTFAMGQDRDYYLDAKSYDTHGAIAECLEELAMDPSKSREWTRGGVKHKHYDYMEMARYHRSLSGSRATTIAKTYRVDRKVPASAH